MSNADTPNDLKSVKSANSNNSLKSKQSNNKELTAQEFKRYRKCQIEIHSLEDLDNPTRR
jgi:hypothetical protein